MATLVLTAVGSAIGGPIGGAIGAAIGQQVDNIIFAPKARQGPRLKELEVQTSSYGSQIPKIFGTMRVAGTVIWATDLVERRAKSGGGKGRPATVNYSYSVSMAVAVSSRPIHRIGRIWADGNLLRGFAGDLKVDTQLRIYNGHEDQPLDPLMASAEAAGRCPAHRGMAYALFEDLQLADYGNRIPSLTFEIVEREGVVPVHSIFEAASGGEVRGSSLQTLRGFAMSGESASEPLDALLASLPIELGSQDDTLVVRDKGRSTNELLQVIPVAKENREAFDPPQILIDAADQFPYSVSLRYYDGERDFQASLQRSERGPVSRNAMQIELPAVLTAIEAKQIVERRHQHIEQDRKAWRGDVALGPGKLSAGSYFLDDAGRAWCVDQLEHRFGSSGISARAVGEYSELAGQAASPGRNLPSPDLLVGETRLAVVEMPVPGNDDPGKPVLAVFASGNGGGWRRAALSLRAGDSLIDIGTTALPAIMGMSLDPVLAHTSLLIDEDTALRVQLLNSTMDMPERSGSPLDVDAPLIWLDSEFMRFGNCTSLGAGIYRLSRLLRGCFKPDNAELFHSVDAPFVLIEPDSARLIEERAFAAGDSVIVEAFGLGDLVPVTGSALVGALATKPLSPVHGSFDRLPDGSVHLGWIRRSRIDSGWRDGVDQMVAEHKEEYRIVILADGLPVGEWTSFEAQLFFTATQWADLAIPPGAILSAEVSQVGRHALSASHTITFT